MAATVVTGAAGRLGLAIALAIRRTGRRVVGLDRHSPAALEAAQLDAFCQCDLAGDPASTVAALRGIFDGAEAVVHCAAWPGPSATPPPAVVRSGSSCTDVGIGLEAVSPAVLLRDNVAMTAAVCDAAVEAGVRRVVFSSSAFAIGWSHAAVGRQAFFPAKVPISEAHAATPFESYGLSKLVGEAVLATAARTAKDTSFVSLRFPNIVKRESWGCLPWPRPRRDRPLPVLMWAYVHEDDVVDAHVAATVLGPEAAAPGSHEVFIIAAPDTRFDVPTSDLLGEIGGHTKGGGSMQVPGRTSPLSSAKAAARLGVRMRSWAPTVAGLGKGGVAAVAARCDAGVRNFPLDGFPLECGTTLGAGAKLCYKVYGAPPDESKGRGLILHPTSFDAVHTEVDEEIGPGKLFDTDRHCVVVPNLMGNGVSFSPSTPPTYPTARGAYPPVITIADNVRAQAAALQAHFGTFGDGPPKLDLIYGYSMGALQALEWAVRYPDVVRRVAAVCGAARCAPVNRSFLLSLEAALCADPEWRPGVEGTCGFFEGTPEAGLKTFARIYSGWGVGSEWYEKELYKEAGYVDADHFIQESYEAAFARSDADDMLAQVKTWLAADVSRPYNGDLGAALRRVQAHVVYLPCDGDRYFTVAAARHEAALLGHLGRVAVIESPLGHRAGDPWRRQGAEREADFIRGEVQRLLEIA